MKKVEGGKSEKASSEACEVERAEVYATNRIEKGHQRELIYLVPLKYVKVRPQLKHSNRL